MSTVQKLSISLLAAVVLFSVFALAAFSGIFNYIESNFYDQKISGEIDRNLTKTASAIENFHNLNLERYKAVLEGDWIQTIFLRSQSREDITTRINVFGKLQEDIPSLIIVRFVDTAWERIHYSTLGSDIRNSTNQAVEYNFFTSVEDADFIERLGRVGADSFMIAHPADYAFVYVFKITDRYDAPAGYGIFYVALDGLQKYLLQNGAINLGEEISFIQERGLLLRSNITGTAKIKENIAAYWDGRETVSPSFQGDKERRYIFFDKLLNDSSRIGIFIAADQFLLNPVMKGVLLFSVFLTTFLVVFLILSVRQDSALVLSERIKKFQINLLREYLDRKEEIDWQRWQTELEIRRDDVRQELKRGLGKINKKDEEKLDQLVDKSWDEIITVLTSRKTEKKTSLELEKIESLIEKVVANMRTLESGLPQVRGRAERLVQAPARPADDEEELEEISDAEAVEAEEAEAVEVEEAEALEDTEDLEEAEEAEEAESLEDAETVEDLAGVEEAEEAEDADLAEIDEVEDAETEAVEDLAEIEEDQAGAAEAVEASGEEAPEEAEDLESLEEIEEAEVPEAAEAAEKISEDEAEEAFLEDVSSRTTIFSGDTYASLKAARQSRSGGLRANHVYGIQELSGAGKLSYLSLDYDGEETPEAFSEANTENNSLPPAEYRSTDSFLDATKSDWGIDDLFGGELGVDFEQIWEEPDTSEQTAENTETPAPGRLLSADGYFQYDDFLKNFRNDDTGITKSLMAVSRAVSSSFLSALLSSDDKNLYLKYQIGLYDRTAKDYALSLLPPIAAGIGETGKAIIMQWPIKRIKELMKLIPPAELSSEYFPLFVPVIWRQSTAFLLLCVSATPTADELRTTFFSMENPKSPFSF